MLFEPKTKLNEVSPHPSVCLVTRVVTAALASLASAQTEISRQLILICDQTEPGRATHCRPG